MLNVNEKQSNRNPIIFETKGRPAFADIDPYGHVNTIHYISYFTSHRFEAMREFIGWDLKKISQLPIAFYIKKNTIEYKKSLRFDQLYIIRSFSENLSETSCNIHCEMVDENENIMAICDFLIICVNQKTGKPCAWPEEVIGKFFK